MKISAKQFTLKRLLALVCVLVLSITAIQWPIRKAEAAVSDVKTIKLKAVEGITWYTEDGEEMLVEDTEKIEATSYSYQYSNGFYEIKPRSGQFSSKVIFYVESEGTEKPSVTPDNNATTRVANDVKFQLWKVTVTLTNASGDVTLTPTVPKEKHEVSFILTNTESQSPADTQKTVYEVSKDSSSFEAWEAGHTETVEDGDTLNFVIRLYKDASKSLSVTRDSGAQISATKGTTGHDNNKGDYVDYKYNIREVKSDIAITISVSDKAFTVNLPEGVPNNYTVTPGGNNIVYYGGSYSFYVTPAEGVNKPEVKYHLSASREVEDIEDQLLKEVAENNYVIANITNNAWVTIESGAEKTYDVSLTPGVGYSYNVSPGGQVGVSGSGNLYSVQHGKDFSFNVTPTSEYNKSAEKLVVTANGRAVSKEIDGSYKITNITEAQNIAVSGLERNTYKVTMGKGEGENDLYTITSSQSAYVSHGDSFDFTVTLKSGYEIKEQNLNGSVNIEGGSHSDIGLTKQTNGTYTGTVENIKEDIKISISNGMITPIMQKITVEDNNNDNKHGSTPPEKGIYTVNFDGFELQGKSVEVPQGTDVTFNVELSDDGYQLDQVAANGIPLTAVEGKYTIQSIDKPMTIQIITTEKSLTISYVDKKHPDQKIQDTKIWYHDSNFQDGGTYQLNEPDASKDEYNTFVGWFKEGAEEETKTISQSELGIGSTLTLTAKWVPTWDKYAELDTNGNVQEVNNLYKVMYQTFIKFLKGYDDDSNIRVTGYGILYSEHDFDPRDKLYMITGRENKSDTSNQQMYCPNKGDQIVNFYYNIAKEDPKQFIGSNELSQEDQGEHPNFHTKFKWSFNTVHKGPYYGIGWMELEVNGETMVVTPERTCEIDPLSE